MCGRFTYRYTWKQLHKLMQLSEAAPALELFPRYNVAPTQIAPVVRQDAHCVRTAAFLRWGLVPFWAQDITIGNQMINARAEEAADKPAFRAAIRKRRCLVPVDGFYEWQVIPGSKRKQPWLIRLRDAELFAFAGLWESWKHEGQRLETFTILTCDANEHVAPIHDRMPVIVRPQDYARWLDPRVEDPADLQDVLRPYPAAEMESIKVGTRVNSPGVDEPSLLEPECEDRGLWGAIG